MDKEIWCDVKGYEGLYQVSNWGRVKSLGNGCSNNSKERILKNIANGLGYLLVHLFKGGECKGYTVHRLVLSTFNPVDGMDELEVNHINEKKDDNRLKNLEWCDRSYNNNYGTRNAKASEKMTNGKLSIPIVQLTPEGKYIRSYKSSHDAQRLGGFTQQAINACCKGKLKTHGNYKWMYLSEFLDKNNGLLID